MCSFDAWVFARLSSGQPCDDQIEAIHPSFRSLAEHLAGMDPSYRHYALGGYIASRRDRDALYKAVADADPLGPAPVSMSLWPACAPTSTKRRWVYSGPGPAGFRGDGSRGSAASRGPARRGSPSTWPGVPTTVSPGPTANP